jgi:hypothetical protein
VAAEHTAAVTWWGKRATPHMADPRHPHLTLRTTELFMNQKMWGTTVPHNKRLPLHIADTSVSGAVGMHNSNLTFRAWRRCSSVCSDLRDYFHEYTCAHRLRHHHQQSSTPACQQDCAAHGGSASLAAKHPAPRAVANIHRAAIACPRYECTTTSGAPTNQAGGAPLHATHRRKQGWGVLVTSSSR